LFATLGWSFIFGFIVIVTGMYVNFKVAKMQGVRKKAHMKVMDKRMNLTNEMLQNIKTIKMYAWENIFLKLVS
jgi:ATP-binding cassette subfamily C (CFTR/MRP) protein 1